MELVTGCPRSGTAYYSAYLCSMGLDMPHERTGADGSVSWMYAVRSPFVPWGHRDECRDNFKFERIVHLIRHPLQCIPSLTTMAVQSWDWIGAELGKRYGGPGSYVLADAVDFWLEWNYLTAKQATATVRIEDVPEVDGLFRNARQHPELTSQMLAVLPRADEVHAMARSYGYTL